jgi:ankyrin repeat protein
MRELDPTIQQFVFKSMPGITTDELFCLCAFYMNGYGVEEDGIKACEQLRKAATQGHYLSRGYLYRLHAACRIEVDSQIPLAEHLYQTAVLGSRMALQDLSVVAPEKVKKAQYSLRNTSGGVGANWYYRDQMLHSIEHVDIQLFKALADETKGINTLRVNRRGDSLLHLAANCGQVDGIEYLIENKQMDVNQVNEQGDTTLLCACRAGQGPIAAPLLKKYGANASIAAHNGETPLHWLVSFRDADIPFVIDDLFSRGADINASTRLRVAHSVFPTGIDVDFQLPGTPLSWAVHNNRPIIVKALLARGANPLLQHQHGCLSPLAWAAYFHHSECLKLLVENLEERLAASDDEKRSDPRYAVEYGPLLFRAIKAADKFSMVLRNGVNYISNLHETLDIIHERTRLIGMAWNFGGADQGPLYYAVAGAHDDVVRYMLQRGWLVDDLNSPCGNHQRTPVLEAVRWNRRSLYDLLVHHGADVTATARNPFNGSQGNWTALHIFAHAGYNEDVSLAETLIQAGVSVDGIPNADVETPLAIAIRNKAFRLADVLLAHGANINGVACKFGLLASSQPLTILGQAIASNMRYASTALTYLLSRCGPPAKPSQTDFIVDPVRGLSALHRCALAFEGLEIVTGAAVQKEEYDMNTNRDIITLLLGTFNKPEQIDFPRRLDGKTALHLAVEVGNAAAVELLLQRGACTTIASDAGETALDMARRLRGGAKEWDECLSILEGSDRDRIG